MQPDAPIQRRRRAMAEINVVPYIDVMLVLLIIFMITAPLLNLGIEVELPQGQAESMGDISEPLMVVIQHNGDFYLDTGDAPMLVDGETLRERVATLVRVNPDIQVLIGADRRAAYDHVYEAMVLLQQAGVSSIGFRGDPPEQ
ncbi:MAG: ExbD/TolR family protein [Wenzhouxiangellaceae bacterium]